MKRRDFSKIGIGTLAFQSLPVFASTGRLIDKEIKPSRIPLGLCDWSLRSMKWKAQQHIKYAIEQKLDAVLFNSLRSFASLDDEHLRQLRKMAESHGVRIYMGVGSITQESTNYTKRYGSTEALLAKGIRIALAVGSPIVSCRIGNFSDRYSEGGIEPKIEKAIKVMKAVRGPALDAGIKFAFENHAGDLRSKELLDLIKATGTDICGALFDPANAVWALEDPMSCMQVLDRHILCTSVRDVMAWQTDEGAAFQFTAIGEGLIDYQLFVNQMAECCPGVPLQVETVTGAPRLIPFFKPDFWQGFPDLAAVELLDFLKLIRRGHPIDLKKPEKGTDAKVFEQQYQKSELLKSLGYLRKCGAGLM